MSTKGKLEWQQTPIGQALADTIARVPEQLALLGSGGRRLTYQALEKELETRCQFYSAQGVNPGTIIALVNHDPFDYALSLLVAALLRLCVIPIDPSLPDLVRHRLCKLGMAQFVADNDQHLTATDVLIQPDFLISKDDYMFQVTSGSTGHPKLTVRTQKGMLAEGNAYARALEVTSQDRILAVPPLHHSFGVGLCVFLPLVTGCSLVVLDSFVPRPALVAAEEYEITLLPGVPFMFELMAQVQLRNRVSLKHVRICLAGAAPLAESTFVAFQERFGLPVHSTFGSSETGGATWVPSDDFRAARVGKPLFGVKFEVRDNEGGSARPGVNGRLFLRTEAMARYYLTSQGRADVAGADGWFHTGDLAFVDTEGELYLTGRTEHLINLAGKKVNPVEVENVLLAHESVSDAVVLGGPDPDSDVRLMAFVVAGTQKVAAHTLIAYCRERLAPHQVPGEIRFLPSLPRNAAGKINRDQIRELWLSHSAQSSE